MANVWDKIDSGLATIYANFLRVLDEGADSVARVEPVVAEGGPLYVSLRLTGDIAPVERAGFETTWTMARVGIATAWSGTTISEISNSDPLRAFRSPIGNGSDCR